MSPRVALPIAARSGRFEWEREFRRAGLGKGCASAVGFSMASWASQDGDRIYPGDARVALGLGLSVRSVERAVSQLEGAGWLGRTPGSVGRPGHAVVWHLTMPHAHVRASQDGGEPTERPTPMTDTPDTHDGTPDSDDGPSHQEHLNTTTTVLTVVEENIGTPRFPTQRRDWSEQNEGEPRIRPSSSRHIDDAGEEYQRKYRSTY